MIDILKSVDEKTYLEQYEFQKLPVYLISSENDLQTLYQDNKQEITNHVFEAIKSMIEEKLEEIPVFKIKIGNRLIRFLVHKQRIHEILQECIRNYEETEEYEKCDLGLKLIKKS